MEKQGATAAFFRVERTLTRRNAITTAAWLAANAQGVGERVARLGNVAAAAPLAWVGELQAGTAATRLTWMGLRGMTEDRIVELCREFYETYVEPDVVELGHRLIKQARTEGRRVVLISDNIDHVIKPLSDQLGADDLLCNQLEMRGAKATGRLADPVIGGNLSGQWARSFASEHAIDLNGSCAYGARAADSLLLSAIGRPCAVNPDRQLRRIAKDHDWPVIDE